MAEFQSLKSEVRNWDLTTDEKFYSKLDTFLNNMMTQVEIIQKNTENTTYETNAVSVYLEDTFNVLSNLSNKKFIENSMAAVEEPQIVPKEVKKVSELSTEQRQENYRKAVQNAINVFNITSNDDDELLTKSHTMSMSMFKSTDHLPFLIGSKAFASDEYLGIIDKSEDPAKYLHKLSPDALEEPGMDNMQISPSSGMNQGTQGNAVVSSGSANTVVPGPSGKIELRDNSLLPPGPFHVLLEQYESQHGAGGRQQAGGTGGRPAMGNLMSELTGRANAGAPADGGRANLMAQITGRANMMDEITGRGKLMTEIAGRGRLEETGGPAGRANMLEEITRNRLSTDVNRVSEIRNNPMYQPIQPQQTKGNRLFDEDEEDVEVGNADMFQTKSGNKKKFENLLSNPISNPAAMTANAMFNPLASPFDPFGLQNPFLPFNPKTEVAQKSDVGVGKNPMMGLPTETTFGSRNTEETENTSKVNKLNKLFDDSDDDEEARINKQKLLSQKYRPESKISPLQSEEKAPVSQPKITATATGNTRVSKLFDDDEDDGFMSMRKNTAPPKKEISASKPAAVKKNKLFDEEDEEGNFASKKPEENKKKGIAFDDDEDDLIASRRSKTMAGKGAKPTLFDDDDDDAPIGNKKGKKEEAPVKAKKKTLFDDDEEDEDLGKSKVQPKASITPAKDRKSMFNNEEENPVEKPKVIEEIKPVVQEKPPVYEEKALVYEEVKPVVQEITPERETRSSVQPAIFNEIESKSTQPRTQSGAGSNLTQLIKASQMNKKKRFGDSSEEDSDSDGDSAPIRKTQAQPVTQVVEKQEVEESEPTKQEETRQEEVKQEVPVLEESVQKEEINVQPKSIVEETPENQSKPETEPVRPSVTKPSGISARISALQNQLNLNMDALRPGEGLPPHMRKPKPSIQPEDSSGTNTEIVPPGGLSHTAALSKPKQQARAKKTIMFEDDDDEPEDTTTNKFTFASKPTTTYTEPPKYQEPEVARMSYTQQQQQQPVYNEEISAQRTSYVEPASQRQSTVTKKKVAFNDEVEEAPIKPIEEPTTFGSDNPLALLKGLKDLNENKSSPKKDRTSVKHNDFEDEDEIAKPVSNQRTSVGVDNPMALLSGLKEMDASKERKSKTGGRKSKGIFDEEDENEDLIVPKKNMNESKASTKPKESSNRLTKLFDDSDEDKKDEGFGRKSASPVKTQTKAKVRPSLFDDDE